jgi:hypothetical protein
MARLYYLLAAILVAQLPTSTHAHGRLLEPGSRPSGYLKGFAMPPNYNDHEMNCGGRTVQWDQNGGKCGICGDPWSGPRHYERPEGVMVQHDIITETYQENQEIVLKLQITVAHRGWHEFRICNIAKSGGVEANQECLDKTLLANATGHTRFTEGTTSPGFYEFTLILPSGLTCNHCLIQWKWKCGNDWGCANGWCCTGCGDRQEEFYSCADVAINSRSWSSATTTTTRTWPTTTRPRQTSTTTRTWPTSTTTRPRTTSSTWWYRSTSRQSTTSQQWGTTQRSTLPPTRSTTTAPRWPTTTKPRSSTSKFINNGLFQYLRNQTNFGHSGSSLSYPGRSGTTGNKTAEEQHILNMVLGRGAQIINEEGLSVPVLSDNSTTTTDAEPGNIIESSQIIRDRFCAYCFYGCPYYQCATYCPQVCRSSSSGRQLG